MVRIRQPFFSITTAIIFGLLGLLYGMSAASNSTIVIGAVEINPPATWALTGVMFLLAYFALVHIKD